MRPMAALLAAVVAAGTTACLLPDKQLYPPYDCNQKDLPTTAREFITLRGHVFVPGMNDVVPGAVIEMLDDHNVSINNVSSRMDGSFVFPQGTGGLPLDVHFKISFNNPDPGTPFLDTYFYPAAPFTANRDELDFQMLPVGLAQNFMKRGNVDLNLQQNFLAITVVDCNDAQQPGAKVSTDPAGAPVLYLTDGPAGPTPEPTMMVTDQQTGTAFAANVDGKVNPTTNTATVPITIHATMPNPLKTDQILTLRSYQITSAPAGALIQAEIQP